jgi:hypothetical protein
VEQLLDWLNNPYFHPIQYYITTLFGAGAMYVFSLHQGFQGSVLFLKKIFPERNAVFYHRLDCVLVVCFGSIIGTIFFAPTSTIQALAAGFGWIGSINILMSQADIEQVL